ncbi:MAG: radical SAM family heme chaperone HemW, partial [Myxococcales bacterium]
MRRRRFLAIVPGMNHDDFQTVFGLYIHWPFCERKCPYCDFASQAMDTLPHERFRAAVLAEWARRRAEVADRRLCSIYLGGGTPSLMRPEDLAVILAEIGKSHALDGVEITVEANPSSALPQWLREIRQAGANRLSLGVQSFSDAVLRFLGRLHDARQSRRAIEAARAAGFDNLSLDLILASRPATLAKLDRDLEAALSHRPEHLSAYLLTIEPETPFGRRAAQGERLTRREDEARRCYERCRDRLAAAGYERYEISNHARPDRRSHHNGLYWSGAAYLGLGPSAHGYIPPESDRPAQRRENLRDAFAYLAAVEAGRDPRNFLETLEGIDIARETMLTGLRRIEGVGEREFAMRCGLGLQETFSTALKRLADRGWLEWRGEN